MEISAKPVLAMGCRVDPWGPSDSGSRPAGVSAGTLAL